MSPWVLLVTLSTARHLEYCSSCWVLLVLLSTARLAEYCSSCWVLLVMHSPARHLESCSSPWVLLVTLSTARHAEYCSSCWVLLVTLSTARHAEYCSSRWVLLVCKTAACFSYILSHHNRVCQLHQEFSLHVPFSYLCQRGHLLCWSLETSCAGSPWRCFSFCGVRGRCSPKEQGKRRTHKETRRQVNKEKKERLL